MQVPLQGLQGFTGAVAVGGLTLTSLFLLAAVFAPNLLLAIDVITRSTAWAVVAAIPLSSLAYVVGLLTTAAAESILVRTGRLRHVELAAELEAVVKLSELAVARYHQQRQEAEVLAGSSLALCVLGLASAIAAFSIEGWWRTLISVAVACVALSVGSALLSVYRYRSASSLALAIRHPSR
jgi:hypothetical protein